MWYVRYPSFDSWPNGLIILSRILALKLAEVSRFSDSFSDSMPLDFNATEVQSPFLQLPLRIFPLWPGISDVQGGLSEGGTFLLHMDGVSVPITFKDVKPMLG